MGAEWRDKIGSEREQNIILKKQIGTSSEGQGEQSGAEQSDIRGDKFQLYAQDIW